MSIIVPLGGLEAPSAFPPISALPSVPALPMLGPKGLVMAHPPPLARELLTGKNFL